MGGKDQTRKKLASIQQMQFSLPIIYWPFQKRLAVLTTKIDSICKWNGSAVVDNSLVNYK